MMKKTLFTFTLLLCISLPLVGQPKDQFEKANQFYRVGQFEEAIALYEQIIANGFESGDLYFNLGNAYYKTGAYAKSRLNYERSLIWLKGDEDVEKNLEMLKLHLIDQIEPTPKLFLVSWWGTVLNLLDIESFGYLFLIFFWIMLICAALFLHYRKRGQTKFKGLFSTFLILTLLLAIIWGNKIYKFETEKYGIILNSTVTIHSGPAEDGTELFVIHEGTKVLIERVTSGWYEIKLEDGKTGWLTQNSLEII